MINKQRETIYGERDKVLRNEDLTETVLGFLEDVAELAGSAETATGPLAQALGTTAYELRLVLNAGLPAVVLATVDPDKARAAAAAITDCGHVPVRCDRASVARMKELRAFRLEPSGIVADASSTALLPYRRDRRAPARHAPLDEREDREGHRA